MCPSRITDYKFVGAASLAFAIRASFNLVLALIRLRKMKKCAVRHYSLENNANVFGLKGILVRNRPEGDFWCGSLSVCRYAR